MKANLNLGLAGRFKIIAGKADGSQRVLADWFDNLILNSGLDRLGTGGAWDRCQVGSGNTAPAVGQTALVTLVATTTTIQSTVAGTDTPANTYAFARRTYRFAEGAAAGNLSEVGVGWSAGLFSRALIKDGAGDPTTITVLADEFLDVVYEIRAYSDMSDQVSVVNISGVDYTFTMRPSRLTGSSTSGSDRPAQIVALMTSGLATASQNSWGWYGYSTAAELGPVTGNPTGTQLYGPVSSGNTSVFRTSYVGGSYERTGRHSLNLTVATAAIGALDFRGALGCYQMKVVPSIPKDGTKMLTLDFKATWARRTL